MTTPRADTLADGMATRVPDAGALAIIRAGAARIVTVTDDEVAAAIRAYWQDTHNLAEGAGAAPLAALLQERDAMRGQARGPGAVRRQYRHAEVRRHSQGRDTAGLSAARPSQKRANAPDTTQATPTTIQAR